MSYALSASRLCCLAAAASLLALGSGCLHVEPIGSNDGPAGGGWGGTGTGEGGRDAGQGGGGGTGTGEGGRDAGQGGGCTLGDYEVIELAPGVTGTIRSMPEMSILEIAPVASDVQSTYFKTTTENRELRRGIVEFAVPALEGQLVEAKLAFQDDHAILSAPVPPDTHLLGYYAADLTLTTDDYDRMVTALASVATDANEDSSLHELDVTDLLQAYAGQALGFRAQLDLDESFDDIWNGGSGFRDFRIRVTFDRCAPARRNRRPGHALGHRDDPPVARDVDPRDRARRL